MKVDEDWKLIDLDAAAKIGEKAGLKSSTDGLRAARAAHLVER
jgi:hypothetical protein